MKKMLAVLFVIILFSIPVQAAITDLPDAGGKGYFYDSGTGFTWMDLDNFYSLNYFQVESAISGTGYHIATHAEVQQLVSSAPVAEWSTWNTYMGGSPYRGLIWGAYDKGTPTEEGWAWAYNDSPTWQYNYMFDSDTTAKSSTANDLGAWVVKTSGSSSVPEPTTMLLVGLGLVGLAGVRKKFRK